MSTLAVSNIRHQHYNTDSKVIFLENVHYKSASGDIECGYNVLEINILMHEETEDPVGFGIQVQNENGQIIQTCVILQPFQYKN